ncbi:MAG: 16S rRNA (adenine(1518)-N(6)/adenine(1519)-N(6))-dimethyltransferase RsmA [Patescibacteria group bacterium]|nr:ribosomal RNA small subunit methyltransferase A [Patescibacteria group bacterium]
MDIKHKKELGQNFLTDRSFALKIIEAADLSKDDVVLEVGPGAGVLTQYLANEVGKLVAVEYDERFVHMLKNRFQDEENVKIMGKDIMTLDVSRELAGVKSYKLIGSLPYNISKLIIRKFLKMEFRPDTITVLIQKEVAEDYCAKVPKGTFLSNYVQIFGSAKYIGTVPKEVFSPMPKVDGGIIKISNLPAKGWPASGGKSQTPNISKFIKFLRSAFLNPRKKLIKNLSSIYRIEKSALTKIFKEFHISENARGSNLTFDQWKKLFSRIVGP